MKNLITSVAIAALLAAPAAAIENPEPPQVDPETETRGGGSQADAAVIGLLVILGAVALSQRNSGSRSDLSDPRPTVRPDGCLDKLGNVVGCQ